MEARMQSAMLDELEAGKRPTVSQLKSPFPADVGSMPSTARLMGS